MFLMSLTHEFEELMVGMQFLGVSCNAQVWEQ